MDNNIKKLKVSRKQKKVDKKLIKLLNFFISTSKNVLNVLYKMPKESKENLCMNVAGITEQTSILLKRRSLQLLMISILMADFSNKIEENSLAIVKIKYCKKIFFIKLFNLLKLYFQKIGIKSNIRKLEILSKKYKQDQELCKQALEICSEFGRRLSFFLSL